jgi:hypothetical protein
LGEPVSENLVQASFNSGEWSPQLFARVDLQKYRSGAALLQNFFVDYRGGASTRAGSQYIIQCRDSNLPVRLIPFQAAFNVGYILEFGQGYIRFIFQGSPVLETGFAISSITNANPMVLDIPGHDFVTGDWIFISDVGGMTQINGRYFVVNTVAGSFLNVTDLSGAIVDSTTFGVYTSGGTAQRIYTIASPYNATDLELLKFTQSTNFMIITHPSYATQQLTLISATDWVIAPISIGSTAGVPTITSLTSTLPTIDIFTTPNTPGQTTYSYVVTSIDSQGQESVQSAPATVGPRVDIRTYGGSNLLVWNPVTGAVAYNVYEAEPSYVGIQPPGVFFGFIGTLTGTRFIDSNIAADFTQGPPVAKNPFVGSGLASVTITNAGVYTTVPGVTFVGGGPITSASGVVSLCLESIAVGSGGSGYVVGDSIGFGNGVVLIVVSVSGGAVTAFSAASKGSIESGSVPSNPIAQATTSGAGTGCTLNATWGVDQVIIVTPGLGYTSAPTVTFSAGAAAATAALSPTGNGNPGVCSFFQQRLVLAATNGAPATFWMSQVGTPFNFNITNPVAASNAITGTLVANTLNSIKSIVSVPSGMLIFTDKAAWIVSGGPSGISGVSGAVSPEGIVAAAQSFIGANDMPPITSNYDVLFVESNGSKVRDLAYNIYFNVFTGTDISITSSHLFYGFSLTEWAWAEQPFYQAWVIRNDGTMLTLTFLKEQEFIGWSHQITNGLYTSVATITEPSQLAGTINAVYTVVERTVDGVQYKYIERIAERVFPNGLSSAWCVDAGLSFTGSPELSFQGAEHLRGFTVTGLATDNLGNVTVITPFTMPTNGEFTLPAPAAPATGYTVVTLGLAFTCQLQTLPIDMGEPSIQGKVKKIPFVDVRVFQTLGLSIGSFFTTQIPMQDLIQGNVSSMLTGQPNQVIEGLFSGDARTFIDSTYTVPGQYCFQQTLPYPASILGVFPAIVVGDDR